MSDPNRHNARPLPGRAVGDTGIELDVARSIEHGPVSRVQVREGLESANGCFNRVQGGRAIARKAIG
jgi:hypothetical protein